MEDYEHKLLDIARVARIVAGGRRFSFRVVVAVGDRSGNVGVGIDKGKDVAQAIDKATRDAKKNLIKVPITEEGTIPHEVYAKYCSARVFLKPAKTGRGLVTGGAMRVICDLAGIQNVTGKILSRSISKINNARATIKALSKLKAVKKEESVKESKKEEKKENK